MNDKKEIVSYGNNMLWKVELKYSGEIIFDEKFKFENRNRKGIEEIFLNDKKQILSGKRYVIKGQILCSLFCVYGKRTSEKTILSDLVTDLWGIIIFFIEDVKLDSLVYFCQRLPKLRMRIFLKDFTDSNQ